MSWYKRVKLGMPLPRVPNFPKDIEIYPEDEMMSNNPSYLHHSISQEEADQINTDHPNLAYRGHGNVGMVYDHQNPNTVIKITHDPEEASTARSLIGKDCPCCVRVINVSPVNEDIYKIEIEKVSLLGEEETDIFDLIYIQQDPSKVYEPSLVVKCKKELQQLKMCLKQNNLPTHDLKGENLGRRKGQLVLLDIG